MPKGAHWLGTHQVMRVKANWGRTGEVGVRIPAGYKENENTDERKASAAITVLNHDSFPDDLKLNSQ